MCGALLANPRASASWSAAQHADAEGAAVRTTSSVREPRSRQASISGGSSESEVTAFAVAPAGPPGPGAVTIVTAVGASAIALAELVGRRRGHRGRKV